MCGSNMGMNSNWVFWLIFSAAALLIIWGIMGSELYLCMSKKARKAYKKEVSFIERWFFWSAPQKVKDKDSKYEKQIIRYPDIIAFYRFLNAVLHLMFAVELMVVAAVTLGWLKELIWNAVCQIYLLMCVLILVLLAITNFITNKRYHRSRYKQKR